MTFWPISIILKNLTQNRNIWEGGPTSATEPEIQCSWALTVEQYADGPQKPRTCHTAVSGNRRRRFYLDSGTPFNFALEMILLTYFLKTRHPWRNWVSNATWVVDVIPTHPFHSRWSWKIILCYIMLSFTCRHMFNCVHHRFHFPLFPNHVLYHVICAFDTFKKSTY